VLIAGGTSAGTALSFTELYRSWTSSILANPAMSASREGAVASALQADGTAMVAGGSNLGSTELYGFATIKTDASDYPPGTPVQISGTGWEPGETVTLSLLESPDYDTHPAMTVVADAQGNIANSDFAPDSHDVGIRFYLTAAGAKSQAQGSFTDRTNIFIGLASAPATWVVNQPITFTVTTTTSVGGPPVTEGCVQFVEGSTQLGLIQLGANSTSTNSFGVTLTSLQSHTIIANYIDMGSGNTCGNKGNSFNNAMASLTQSLVGQSSTNLASSASPSLFGRSVTFTATVTPVSPATGTPTGTVNFYDGAIGATCSALASSTSIGTQILSSGSASVSTSNLSVGTHAILGCYQGSSSFGASSGPRSQVVNQATPAIAWSTPTAITYGTALSATQLNATATYQSGNSPATVAGTFTYAPAAGAILSAVNQTLSVHFVPADATDFATPADNTVAINVQPASLTPSITASNKIYDGTNAATFTCSLSGVVGADDVSCTGGTAVFASAAAGSGVTVTATGLQLSGAKAANYTLASTTATTTANITAKSVTISGVTAADKVYDGTVIATLNAANATLQGVIPADASLLSLQSGSKAGSFADKNVGVGKPVTASGFTLSGASAGNYTLSQPTGLTASITAKFFDRQRHHRKR
jgi:hypothetical protein